MCMALGRVAVAWSPCAGCVPLVCWVCVDGVLVACACREMCKSSFCILGCCVGPVFTVVSSLLLFVCCCLRVCFLLVGVLVCACLLRF